MKKILIILLVSLANIYSANASKLMITPTRIEFKGSNRTSEVRLINRSDEETTYRISFQNLMMEESGSYKEIKPEDAKGDENFAHKLIRFSPRRFTLKPGEVQLVRFMVRKPKDLKIGEYRSHALFSEEAAADFGNNIENQNKKNDNISVVLKPLFGISIPVIVTHGDLDAKAQITDAKIKSDKRGKQIIAMKLSRSGNASLYGDIIATLKPNNSDKEFEIGAINGISIFYPHDSRNAEMKVDIPSNINLKDSVIDIKYYKKESGGSGHDKNQILAQKQIAVGAINSRVNY
jgi:hypothetical protein